MSKQRWQVFVREEWLLVVSMAGLVGTSVALRRIPAYTFSDFQILFLLWVLFVVTHGLQRHRVLLWVAGRLERGRYVAIKLVLATFFFAMLVTNDVALLTLVPMTMLLRVRRKDWLVILEVLAANAGSALSPFGNPQNLFIYWHYHVALGDFVRVIGLFSLAFLVLLGIAAWVLQVEGTTESREAGAEVRVSWSREGGIYLAALGVVALVVLRVLPLAVAGGVLVWVFWRDRKSLHVDYALLATFACFFGFTDNLRVLLATALAHPRHVFLLSAGLSQIISNVPAALLLADFTPHWHALLWGVSVGGFGSLIGSLANVIAYRIYVRETEGEALRFALRFHAVSYVAFFVGVGLYWWWL